MRNIKEKEDFAKCHQKIDSVNNFHLELAKKAHLSMTLFSYNDHTMQNQIFYPDNKRQYMR